jgi:small subunit ribosomal protein S4
MARYIGPRCRKSRRLGSDLSLTSGIRALDSKCKLTVPPGMHGGKRTRISDYGRNLLEKQRLCWTYGVSENTLFRYYRKASRLKNKGYQLLRLLECRLDNVVYRMGFAATRAEARQLISHKTVLVNGRTVNIASYQVSPGSQIGIRDKSKTQTRILAALELAKQRPDIGWIVVNVEQCQGILKLYPEREELPQEFKENQVIEFYSK